MADPLLTSLCTICHIQTPKYKCPRCAVRTCSLQCISKHKKWASCSGERDPTVYIPPSKLKTDAGIDHDYNFLTKIERSIETAEKMMREERDILPPPGHGAMGGQQQQQHQNTHPNKRARFNDGGNGSRHTQHYHEDSQHQGGVAMTPSRRWDKASHFRLRKLGVHVAAVPYGMTRSRENKTSWNKRTRTINWQVEWFVHEDEDVIAEKSIQGEDKMETEADADVATNRQQRPTRIMYKILDETPLAQGFEASRESFRHAQMTDEERLVEKTCKKGKEGSARDSGTHRNSHKAPSPGQDPTTSSWTVCATAAIQLPTTTAWRTPAPVTSKSGGGGGGQEKEKPVIESEYKFFYQRPRVPSRQTQKLVPLDPADGLAKILPGLEIVEFPTIHVFPKDMALPAGYAIDEAPKHREMAMRSRQRRSHAEDGGEQVKNENGKRKASGIVEYESSDQEDEDDDGGPEELGGLEEEAVGQDGGGDDPADTTSSSGSSDEDESDEDMEE